MIEVKAVTELIYTPILVSLRIDNKIDMDALRHLAVQEMKSEYDQKMKAKYIFIPVDPLHADAIEGLLENLHKALNRV